MGTLDDLFHALADPTRREILDRLRGGALAVGELAVEFPVSRPAISKHLAVLEDAGLVTARKEGRRRVYERVPEPLAMIDGWLKDHRRQADRPQPLGRRSDRPSKARTLHPSTTAPGDEDWRVW